MKARTLRYSVLLFLAGMLAFPAALDARAAEVRLKNGDRITGTIVSRNSSLLIIRTEAMGDVKIAASAVDKVAGDKSKVADNKIPEIIWKRELSLGYNLSRGNTETGELSGDLFINRNRKHVDEITLRGNVYYSEANKKMDAQKWYTLGRYAFSFGPGKKWYNFYRVEVDHDRFSDIYYRLIPAVGAGYWFFDTEALKALGELGVGWEHVDYYGGRKDNDEPVLIPRFFVEKTLFRGTTISEDLYYYPEFGDFDKYRLRSETALTCDMNEVLALRISLIDEYNSDPAEEETKNNDLRLTSSLVCSF